MLARNNTDLDRVADPNRRADLTRRSHKLGYATPTPTFMFLIYPIMYAKNKKRTNASPRPSTLIRSLPMSTTMPSSPTFQPSLFLDRLVVFLMPYFLALTPDFEQARAEVLETLASYGARTRSEMISAAQIIAFSFAALEMLAEAQVTEMSPSMRLRFNGCANGLNRSCRQNETRLAKSLACDLPTAADSRDEPANDVPDAEVEEALQYARVRIDSYRNRLSGAQAMPASQRNPDKRLSNGAMMMDALARTALPVPTSSVA
jgi:hypothetical protein